MFTDISLSSLTQSTVPLLSSLIFQLKFQLLLPLNLQMTFHQLSSLSLQLLSSVILSPLSDSTSFHFFQDLHYWPFTAQFSSIHLPLVLELQLHIGLMVKVTLQLHSVLSLLCLYLCLNCYFNFFQLLSSLAVITFQLALQLLHVN